MSASSKNPAKKPDTTKPADDRAPDAPKTNTRGSLILIGLLLAALGFAIAVQVRANSAPDALANLRQDDLVSILDNQNARAERLRQQIAALEAQLAALRSGGDQSAAAQAQAKAEEQTLSILLGTIPATGPGVVVTVADPGHRLGPEDLLDVVEELRGAGAEAIEFGGVRVSTDSAFTADAAQILLDGYPISSPYRVLAIGDPTTLDTALIIPGGVAATIRTVGGSLTVSRQAALTITSTRPLPSTTQTTPSGH